MSAAAVPGAPLLEMSGICKRFPGVVALDQVSMAAHAREVHALMGENGAGKSTLMKILSGVYRHDEGTIRLAGAEIAPTDPRAAQHLGIAIIHQELNQVPELTVAENFFLGRERRKAFGVLDDAFMRERTRHWMAELGIKVDPSKRLGTLRVAERQLLEIAKAISLNAKVLVMDEPTTALNTEEVHRLFKLVLVNAQRDSSKQIADVENLLTQKVDALIISPNEAAPLTAVVKRAYDKGVPVIVLDRNVLGESYTMFIGADNKLIGKKAGEYIAKWCAEKKLEPCNVLEVSGLSGSTPAQERGEGLRDGIKANPAVKVGASVTSEWQKAKAVPAAAAAFQANKNFQVVYAHNDDSTEGAYIAAKNASLDLSKMLFVGIDGLPDKNGAIVSVLQGRLGASFVYPNGAAEAVEWVSRILEKGEKPPKKIVLGTDEITPANAKAACEKYDCEFK